MDILGIGWMTMRRPSPPLQEGQIRRTSMRFSAYLTGVGIFDYFREDVMSSNEVEVEKDTLVHHRLQTALDSNHHAYCFSV
jgi:hypothetical protein